MSIKATLKPAALAIVALAWASACADRLPTAVRSPLTRPRFTVDASSRVLAYVSKAAGTTVLNTSDNSTVATIVEPNPGVIAIAPNGRFVYRSINGLGRIDILRTSDNAIIGNIPIDQQALQIVFAPDGAHAYVTMVQPTAGVPGELAIIRTSDNTVEATVPMNTPVGVAVSPDGSHLYVPDAYTGFLTIFQTSDNSVLGTLRLVSVIGTSTNAVVATLTVNPQPIDIAIGAVPRTPADATTMLENDVTDLGLGAGLTTSLLTKLNAVLAAVAANDTATACSALQDFINEVKAQSGKKISTADATKLIDEANAIRTQLGC